MIGLAGTKADPVMIHFAARCLMRGVPFAVIDLVDIAATGDWSLSVPPSPDDGFAGSEVVRLDELTGLYVRPIFVGPRTGLARWRGLVEGFETWLDETPLVVVNRPGAHQLNSYKPAHYAWLSANGLTVPPSLQSRDSLRLKAFLAAGRTVVKPLCGTRATTREIQIESLDRLEASEGPILVQRLIEGHDVRVHVIGDQVVACRFVSNAIDYRSDRAAERTVIDIPTELAELLVGRTAEQGLLFAGWDFKVDRDGRYWSLECNPMPGYSYYDRACGGAISDALVRILGGWE